MIRQAQVRYWWRLREKYRVAVAAETPQVSLTGGQGVNQIPDIIGRVHWDRTKDSHLQGAVVLRQVRGESFAFPGDVKSEFGWGLSFSGVFPFHRWNLTDRFIFQANGGVGIARYLNDLSSLGGQDGVFDPVTGDLEALPVFGWYLDYEHMWRRWQFLRDMNLRSTLIWSTVIVNNTDFQPPESYHKTERLAGNLIFSPSPRVDVGLQYIWGKRRNLDGQSGTSSQVQIVSTFVF